MKLRSGMAQTEAALSRPGRYRDVRDNLRVKEVNVGDGDAAERFIVCHNPSEAERDRARREQRLARIETELARLKLARERAKTKAERDAHQRGERALRDHKTLSRYLRQTKTGRLVIDRERVVAEQRLDGKYLLTTSDSSLSAENVALGSKQLLEAERSFRDPNGPPPISWSQVVVVVVAVRNRRLCTDFSRAAAHVSARARPSGSPAAWSASNSTGERIPSVECSRVGF
jgi:hypothetical protein